MVRVRRVVVPILVLAASLFVIAASPTRPPANLHRIGDHWTAYYPPDPATFPPGSRVHIIRPGDTLWDLARTFYGSPYLWPQLWEANTYIRDAHWIYPGDPLLVQGEAGAIGVTEVGDGGDFVPVAEDPDAIQYPLASSSGAQGGSPIALGTEADLYCWGYLGEVNEALPNAVASFEDFEVKMVAGAVSQDTGVAEGEIVYVRGGLRTGIVPGETYLVVRPAELVTLPGTRNVIGRHYDFRGQVRILCASDDEATALVTQSCSDILVGDRLKPLPQLPIPLSRQTPMRGVCDEPSGRTTGYIVNSKDHRYALGVGSLVEVNLGARHAIQPGDFLTVFRQNPVAGMPEQVLGEIGILTTNANSATGRIVRMRFHMEVGDQVEIK
jgi:hypothetical protein